MRATRLAGILLAAMGLAAAATHAVAKEIAVVIGNDAYVEIPQLSAGVNDARAMQDGLTRAGFTVELVENGTKRQISRALATVEGRIEPGDTVVFHYSGHGFEIDGQNWLLPIDVPAAREGEAGLVKDAAFNAADVIDRFRARGAGTVVAILDACRNNPFAKTGTRAIAGSRGLARMDASGGVFIMFSAGSKQEALDKLSPADPSKTSVFVRSVLPLIARPELTLIDIAKETQEKVRMLARSVGHEQIPAYYDGIVGRVTLTGALPVPKIEPAIQQPGSAGPAQPRNAAAEDVFWQSIQNSSQPAMFEAYLAQVRGRAFSGTYAKIAELKLAALQARPPPGQPAPVRPGTPDVPSGPPLPERTLSIPPAALRTSEMEACDMAAADPRDPDRPTGVAGRDLPPGSAFSAVSVCAGAASQDGAPRRVFYQLGRAQEAGGNGIDAIRQFEKAAELGHPMALYTLADRLLTGQGVMRDPARALALFFRAADAGVPQAVVRIGLVYANGRGAERDDRKAIAFYNMALKLNEPTVYAELGAAYLQGRGVIRDARKACDLFAQGAALGNAAAAASEKTNCPGR